MIAKRLPISDIFGLAQEKPRLGERRGSGVDSMRGEDVAVEDDAVAGLVGRGEPAVLDPDGLGEPPARPPAPSGTGCGTAPAPQYAFAIGRSSAGKRVITLQPVSVTTTSSSMRAAEKPSVAGQ